MDKEAGRYWS